MQASEAPSPAAQPPGAPAQRPALAWPETAIGLGALTFAIMVAWQTHEIPVSPLYAKVGPTVFPYLTAGGLAILSVFLIVQGLRGGWQPEEESEVAVDVRAVLFVLAGLVFNVAVIDTLGFTAASTGLFVLVTYGFGSRQVLRNALIGFAVALVSYFGFAKVLGVNIGAGVVERLFGG